MCDMTRAYFHMPARPATRTYSRTLRFATVMTSIHLRSPLGPALTAAILAVRSIRFTGPYLINISTFTRSSIYLNGSRLNISRPSSKFLTDIFCCVRAVYAPMGSMRYATCDLLTQPAAYCGAFSLTTRLVDGLTQTVIRFTFHGSLCYTFQTIIIKTNRAHRHRGIS